MAEQKIDELKISEEEANAVRISNSADRPNAFSSYRESKKTAADVKKMFDAPFELLREKHDKTVDELRKYNAAESEREAAETEREEAETERANAEQERKTAEITRDEKIDEIYEAYKSGQLKGDKGDKGDPGSVNLVQTTGDSKKDAMSQKATTEYVKEYIPKVATKNLLAVTWENAQLNIFDGAYIKHGTGMQFVASPDYIEVVGGDTYTLSWIEKTTSADVRVFEYRADKTFIKFNYAGSASRLLTFTTDSDCAYVRVAIQAWYADIPCETVLPDNFQMELGTEATAYIRPLLIDPDAIDYTPAGAIAEEKIFPINSKVEQMTDNFTEGEKITYSFGEADYSKLLLSTLSTFSTFAGWSIPIMKSSLGGEVRGVTMCLVFNKPEMPVVLELYDQNKFFIKKLAEETVTGYQVEGLEDGVYAMFHTFKCEFDKSSIPTDVAYLRVYIPNLTSTSTERIRLGRTQDGTVREEINVNITPRYYTVVGDTTWRADETIDGAGGYVIAPEDTFVQIVEKTLEIKASESGATFDYAAYGLPVLEFEGNISAMSKDVAVDLTYKYGDREGSCTLKWQGSSSIAHPKKNYTVKFDNAFEAKEGWGEQKKYCLKANYIDFSHSRNLCCAKLWGDVVKSRTPANETLNALPNAGAVDGFPICVVINGEYKGVYTFNIPKDGWMFGMGDGANEAILCADASTIGACSFDALATLDGDFDVEYVPDEDNIDWVRNSVNRLIQACMNSDGTDLDTTIAQYLDWESAIDYYAHCLITQNYDGITKNYLLATYDGVKWFFSAYDMDSTFGLWWDGSSFISILSNTVEGVAANHRIFRLIKTYKADALKARYKELVHNINGALSEENVVQTFTNFAGSIPKALLDEEVKIWPTLPSTSTNNVSQIIDFNRRRRAYIDPQIEAL